MAKHRKASDNGKRLGAGALALAGASGALIGLDGAAHAASADNTRFFIGDAANRAYVGDSVRIVGALVGPSNRPVKGRLVYLQRHNSEGWHNVDSGRTYSNGRIGFNTKITATKYYRLAFGGDSSYKSSQTKYQRVTAVKGTLGDKIVKKAAAQAGDPYSYGATGPDSFDCSGLTQYAHKLAKKSIPRTASQQYSSSKKVAKGSKKAGDLIFFHDGGGVYHTGVYAGSGKIWHAPQSGDVVRKADIWTSSYSVGRYW